MAIDHLKRYAHRVRERRRADPNAPETAIAPAFQLLLEDLLPTLPGGAGLLVAAEFRNPGVGRPDIALARAGTPPRAFVELKAPSKSADPTRWRDHDKRQYERFREFGCWATCNFAEFRLFERDEQIGVAAVVPELALRSDRDDARADREVEGHDFQPFLQLLARLCLSAGQEPAARDAEHLATLTAHSARLVRSIVRDRLAELRAERSDRHPLMQVRQEFRDVLYSHPEAGGYPPADFDELFSAAFAQTLAFGLLLVREASGEAVGADAWEQMPDEHPLMRTALRVLSFEEVVFEVGVGFDVILDTVNSFSADILAIHPGQRDPILYFYEDFLRVFDPQARERYGVYYTPLEVVRYMTAALDRALRENLGTAGLADPTVTILDPATGTGTFLLGIAERLRSQIEELEGAATARLALRDLAGRMFGFELLVGPYAVAHYRLHHALRARRPGEAEGEPLVLPRLGVYLADTLSEPGAAAPAGQLGFVADGIAEERRAANHIKSEQPILAIIGNPPYRRLEEGEDETLVGRWMNELWSDLKEPVRAAGHGNQLNTFPELSVAFWRWAIWKLFEAENAPQRGVVAFITNRKFLTGWPYAGLRQMMRERFDRIEIVDLRGDVRRGERAGVEAEQGVFNIQVGTAITLAIADGSRAHGELAEIRYNDSWAEGRFSRRAKFDWLLESAAGEIGPGPTVFRDRLDDMRPEPFLNGEWISLGLCFNFRSSGLESKRDAIVYDHNRQGISNKIADLIGGQSIDLEDKFNPTPQVSLQRARAVEFDRNFVRQAGYRPLDRRWHYSHPRWNDRVRPTLGRVWGDTNVCLFAMPSGTNAGPGVWCHGDFPDRHAFRGSYGGYAFPLHDRRPDVNASNLAQALIESLSVAYGLAERQVVPGDVFDAILCLLSATSYSLRFAEDLEDVFPHVPFPASHSVFQEAVRIGREIRALETFSRAPRAAYRRPNFARLETEPLGRLAEVEYEDGEIVLCADGSGRISNIPAAVWSFAVSGYRLAPRWLEGRVGLPADDLALVREFRDICGRIAELIDLFAEADTVLAATLEETLTREALGFAQEEHAPDDE